MAADLAAGSLGPVPAESGRERATIDSTMSKQLTFAISLILAPQVLAQSPSQSPSEPPSLSPPSWLEAHRLKNGVLVHVLEVEDATEQSAFTMLPVGLDSDPDGRAQFSHLAEHMMIRSTDPKRLTVGKIRMNGETTTSVMRLESLAPASDWRAALTRHAHWLTARKFDEKVLAREKVRIASEEQFTVKGRVNHKWATVVWAQHMAGRKHIAVHGDVANATIEQIESYVASRVQLREAHMFLSGPRPAKELIAALEAEFAQISSKHRQPTMPTITAPKSPVTSRPEQVVGHRALTWDLSAKHYLEWYELPANGTRAEAMLLSQLLTQSINTLSVGDATRVSRVGIATRREGRNYLVLSSDFPDGSELEQHQTEFAMALSMARFENESNELGELHARQLLAKPNFATLRKSIPERFRSMIEANVSMQIGYRCMRLDILPTALPAALRGVTKKRLDVLLAGCTEERRFCATIDASAPPK